MPKKRRENCQNEQFGKQKENENFCIEKKWENNRGLLS